MKRMHRKPGDRAQAAAPQGNWLLKVGVALALVAVAAGGTFALFEFVLLPKVPAEMVGRWQVVGGTMNGAVMEFHRDGTMIGRHFVDGKEAVLEGSVVVRGKTLHTTTVNPFTNRAETGIQTIVTLTETEMITEEKSGTRVTMKRVQ
jgi:uncharacterized protein (TIGR03066 family)